MQIAIKFEADHLVRALEAVRRQIATPRQMLASVGEALLPVTMARHAQGLAPDGSKWKPLAPSTIGSLVWNKQGKHFREETKTKSRGAMHSLNAYRKAAGSKRVLYTHGDLLRFHYQVQGDTLRIGTNDWKGQFHHYGTQPYTITPTKARALSFGGVCVKRVHHPGLPARPLVGFPAGDQQLMSGVIEDHLTLALRGARGR